ASGVVNRKGRQGRNGEAKSHFEVQAAPIRREAVGKERCHTAVSSTNCGRIRAKLSTVSSISRHFAGSKSLSKARWSLTGNPVSKARARRFRSSRSLMNDGSASAFLLSSHADAR